MRTAKSRLLSLFSAQLLWCGSLSAQTFGRVEDLTTRAGVEGAVVTSVIGRFTTGTRARGDFTFRTTVRTPDTLVVSHPDFVTARVPLGALPEGWGVIVRLVPRPLVPGSTSDGSANE